MGDILADHRVSVKEVFKGEEGRGVEGAFSAGEQHLADRCGGPGLHVALARLPALPSSAFAAPHLPFSLLAISSVSQKHPFTLPDTQLLPYPALLFSFYPINPIFAERLLKIMPGGIPNPASHTPHS